MIYLDTHVIIWLYMNEVKNFSNQVIQLIENNDLFISPMVLLELEYMHEINRITLSAMDLFNDLKSVIGLSICDKPFQEAISRSLNLKWTRDPFDRIIVAQAMIDQSVLVTKDSQIRNHYQNAIW